MRAILMWCVFKIIFLVIIFCGCSFLKFDSEERLTDKHYVLNGEDVSKLDGPYIMEKILSPTTILIAKNGEKYQISLRGCVCTSNDGVNFEAIKTLKPLFRGNVYLLKNSIVWITHNMGKAVVYTAANRVHTGQDEKGLLGYRNLSYIMPQLLQLVNGEVLLDHLDTEFSLYGVFFEAQAVAQKKKNGVWHQNARQ